MTTFRTEYAANIYHFAEKLAAYLDQGFDLEPAISSDPSSATFQPACNVIHLESGAWIARVRLNAMAEGTHHTKRAAAFNAAVAVIKSVEDARDQNKKAAVK